MHLVLVSHCVPKDHSSCSDNTIRTNIRYLHRPHMNRLQNQKTYHGLRAPVVDKTQIPPLVEEFRKQVVELPETGVACVPGAIIFQKFAHYLAPVYELRGQPGRPLTPMSLHPIC